MKTYLIHHTPKTAAQDTWAVSFSLPYIADQYARAGDSVWYVKTWLTAEQIKKRLAILFDGRDELHVHELGREEASINGRIQWLAGRLEHEEPTIDALWDAPRAVWSALNSVVQAFATPVLVPVRATKPENSRAA